MTDSKPGDKGKGGVEVLRHYWQHGEGAAKIRWGEPHDFDRCVRHISKHLDSERSKRVCAQWHHDVLGVWPGQEH